MRPFHRILHERLVRWGVLPEAAATETLADLAFANKLNLPSMTAEMHK